MQFSGMEFEPNDDFCVMVLPNGSDVRECAAQRHASRTVFGSAGHLA
jgi:hypothetical protein